MSAEGTWGDVGKPHPGSALNYLEQQRQPCREVSARTPLAAAAGPRGVSSQPPGVRAGPEDFTVPSSICTPCRVPPPPAEVLLLCQQEAQRARLEAAHAVRLVDAVGRLAVLPGQRFGERSAPEPGAEGSAARGAHSAAARPRLHQEE